MLGGLVPGPVLLHQPARDSLDTVYPIYFLTWKAADAWQLV
jgi:hypothetical protein